MTGGALLVPVFAFSGIPGLAPGLVNSDKE